MHESNTKTTPLLLLLYRECGVDEHSDDAVGDHGEEVLEHLRMGQ